MNRFNVVFSVIKKVIYLHQVFVQFGIPSTRKSPAGRVREPRVRGVLRGNLGTDLVLLTVGLPNYGSVCSLAYADVLLVRKRSRIDYSGRFSTCVEVI